ncbi:class I SAM-dependent methyltransferase [Candidatus Woesearchaeota archaeon]|nr:class I SAM-dependent methyltransferase [Candidatus Woesearchaeota archaeon]
MSNQYAVRSPEYLQRFSTFRDGTSLEHIAMSVERLQEKRNLQIADMMCGDGAIGKFLVRYFGVEAIKLLVFIDGSQKMLDALPLDALPLGASKVLADVQKLDYPANQFDIMVCRYGLNNLEIQQYLPVLRGYLRTLREYGILTVQDHFPKNDPDAELINTIEGLVAVQDGRDDKPYIPPISQFEEWVALSGGRVVARTEFTCVWSLRERFECKGRTSDGVTEELKSLSEHNKTGIEIASTPDDIMISYPIATFTIQK